MKRVHIFVSGKVQGVFFRAYTASIAKKYGIFGFVRNCPDGKVEIVAEGKEQDIEAFCKEVKKGPPSSIVKEFVINQEQYKGQFNSFKIIY